MTTTDKVLYLINNSIRYSKKRVAIRLGISRPTLDSRLKGKTEWKVLEVNYLNLIYGKFVSSK